MNVFMASSPSASPFRQTGSRTKTGSRLFAELTDDWLSGAVTLSDYSASADGQDPFMDVGGSWSTMAASRYKSAQATESESPVMRSKFLPDNSSGDLSGLGLSLMDPFAYNAGLSSRTSVVSMSTEEEADEDEVEGVLSYLEAQDAMQMASEGSDEFGLPISKRRRLSK